VKPVSGRRLSDLVAVGLLTKVFPPAMVDEVIEQAGRTEQRSRSLPARLMAYFAIGMGLYSEGSYEEVMSQVADGLSWVSGRTESLTPPSKSAIFQARARLGPEPLEALFVRVAGPFGTPGTTGGRLAGKRLVALDSICLSLQDTPVNADFFGRPRMGVNEKAPPLPQARLVVLAECGTAAIFEAVIGACTAPELALAGGLIERIQPGMLLIADRSACSYQIWRDAIGTGADLLWKVRTGLHPEHQQMLGDGSWLALIHPSGDDLGESIRVRVIDSMTGDRPDDPPSYQLFTTILDAAEASGSELAAAYLQRWDIERALDELKTHHSGSRAVLRSRSPGLVLQEIWGYLCCHYAIRSLLTGRVTNAAATDGRTSVPSAASPHLI
jgi:hypothetical protein